MSKPNEFPPDDLLERSLAEMRQQALPDGPKAADNLLKLAMSLDALGRDKEACVVLQQVVTKFKKSSTSVTDKATQERKRIGCSH